MLCKDQGAETKMSVSVVLCDVGNVDILIRGCGLQPVVKAFTDR